ncbi:MAG TPA: bifunctional 5,10-methylenetetrahydrofolate dehydrogenase/5,10-methenyltetrahydrofolate cyclohydrolase [Ktedonobacterales bacterium]|nr:bifunctional 5,10-methylenetetrahydrofolate dehydrogenase/5,10-methenyltetrahydrofolate cyclohydrolase [Ktedonobacterales bacterium]
MGATILAGRELARQLQAELTQAAAQVADARGRAACLTLALVGADPTASFYAGQVAQSCAQIGVRCDMRSFPAEISETALRAAIAALSARADVDGVALLVPLPPHIRQRVVMEALAPEKDVDGLGPRNAGRLMLGFPGFVPSTADAALELLRSAGVALQGKNAVVLGRSNVGGRPAALLFLRENATVTLCHSRTPDLPSVTRQGEIVFASMGRPRSVTGAMIQSGAVVLDAGMTSVDGQIVGDVDFASARAVAGYLTPAPGGLGPLTNLMLIRHTLVGPT